MTRGILKHPVTLLVFILVAAAALRVPHLGGPLDEPHAWRQADAAQFARAFEEEGFDLLHPSVCWLGRHKALVLEFPLAEGVTAALYRVAGGERLPLARAVTLAFYLGAAAYLFLLVRLLFDVRVAGIATAVFCVLPLGLYYSRAIHADPAALMFAHATAYHALRALDGGTVRHFVALAACAVLAALVKVPYVFYFALPIAAFAAARFDARRFAWLAVAGFPAVLAMFVWRHHAAVVNATVPDWSFIPRFTADFAKHVEGSSRWFFGEAAQRWDPAAWGTLAHRFRASIAGPLGTLLTVVGVAVTPLARRRWGGRSVAFTLAWLAGVLVYVLIFMGLNVIHDYYQLPLLAVVATLSAVALELLRAESARVLKGWAWVVLGATIAVLGAHALRAAAGSYYKMDAPRIEAAAVVRAHTPDDALVIAAVAGSNRTDDPRLLYRAHRYGWSVAPTDLTPDVIAAMRPLGAGWLAVVVDGKTPPGVADIEGVIPSHEYPLARTPWRVLLFDLDPGAAR